MPEAILALYSQAAGSEKFGQAAATLAEFIEQLDPFPTPWGLKWIVEARGICKANFAQPVTERRLAQAAALKEWFANWQYGTAKVAR